MITDTTGSGGPETRTVKLDVLGMDCPSCAEKIVNSVSTLDGVVSVEPQVMTGTVHVECRPEKVGVDAAVERVQAAGYDVESRDDLQTERFDVPTMDCASCAGKIENALDSVAGIQNRETLPTTGTVIVTYDPAHRIIELVEDAQRDKTDHEQFVDRFAGQYTPVVITLAVLIAAVPPLLISGIISLGVGSQTLVFAGDWATWFRRGLAAPRPLLSVCAGHQHARQRRLRHHECRQERRFDQGRNASRIGRNGRGRGIRQDGNTHARPAHCHRRRAHQW
jgi:cation transport ATPase